MNFNLTLSTSAVYWDLLEKEVVVESDLQKLKNRDPVFLRQIFSRINPVLFRVLEAQKIFAEQAEDLVSQTWEKFFSNIDQFEGRSEIQTFVCGILFNKIREERRRAGKIILEDDSEEIFSHAFGPSGLWAKAPQDPSQLRYNQEVSVYLQECLEGLTEQQKAAFVLREVHEEDSEEICQSLGVSLANLRVLLFRAKDKLRLCLSGHLGERP